MSRVNAKCCYCSEKFKQDDEIMIFSYKCVIHSNCFEKMSDFNLSDLIDIELYYDVYEEVEE